MKTEVSSVGAGRGAGVVVRASPRKWRVMSNGTYVSAMKMCTRRSASFSYSCLASSTSRLRMSLFRAPTLQRNVPDHEG